MKFTWTARPLLIFHLGSDASSLHSRLSYGAFCLYWNCSCCKRSSFCRWMTFPCLSMHWVIWWWHDMPCKPPWSMSFLVWMTRLRPPKGYFEVSISCSFSRRQKATYITHTHHICIYMFICVSRCIQRRPQEAKGIHLYIFHLRLHECHRALDSQVYLLLQGWVPTTGTESTESQEEIACLLTIHLHTSQSPGAFFRWFSFWDTLHESFTDELWSWSLTWNSAHLKRTEPNIQLKDA